jgi:hypothetical protein
VFGLSGIFGAAVFAHVIAGNIALIWLRRILVDLEPPAQPVPGPQVGRHQQEAV